MISIWRGLPDRTSQSYLHHIRDLRIERDQKLRTAIQKVREQFTPRRKAMRDEQQTERRELKDRQSRLHIRIFTMLDLTGITRRRQEAARKELSVLHKADRKELSAQYRESRNFAESAVKDRYAGKIENQQGRRLSHLAQLEERHRQVEIIADRERQQRELEREQMRETTGRKIQSWKKAPPGQEKTQADPTFMKALQKAVKQEDDRGKNMDDGKDRER